MLNFLPHYKLFMFVRINAIVKLKIIFKFDTFEYCISKKFTKQIFVLNKSFY